MLTEATPGQLPEVLLTVAKTAFSLRITRADQDNACWLNILLTLSNETVKLTSHDVCTACTHTSRALENKTYHSLLTHVLTNMLSYLSCPQ